MDFPEPETPVTVTNFPKGNSTVRFLRLFSFAPLRMIFPLSSLFFSCNLMSVLSFRYFPVTDLCPFRIWFTVPSKTTSPPWTPAPGYRPHAGWPVVQDSAARTNSVLRLVSGGDAAGRQAGWRGGRGRHFG